MKTKFIKKQILFIAIVCFLAATILFACNNKIVIDNEEQTEVTDEINETIEEKEEVKEQVPNFKILESSKTYLSSDMMTRINDADETKIKRREYIDESQFLYDNEGKIKPDFYFYEGPIACFDEDDNLIYYEMNGCEILAIDENGELDKNKVVSPDRRYGDIYSFDEFGRLSFAEGFVGSVYLDSITHMAKYKNQSAIIDGRKYAFNGAGIRVRNRVFYDSSDGKYKYVSYQGIVEEYPGFYGGGFLVGIDGCSIGIDTDYVIYSGRIYIPIYSKNSPEYKNVMWDDYYVREEYPINLESRVNGVRITFEDLKKECNKKGFLIINNEKVTEEEINKYEDGEQFIKDHDYENIIDDWREKEKEKNKDKNKIDTLKEVDKCIETKIDFDKKGFIDIKYNKYYRDEKNRYEDAIFNNTKLIDSKCYIKDDGTLAKDEIIEIDGKKYIFDTKQVLVQNAVYEKDNKIYLTDNDGAIIEEEGFYGFEISTQQIKKDNGNMTKYYYVNDKGLLTTNKFFEKNNKYYYAGLDGLLVRNSYIGDDYYFDEKGELSFEYPYDVMRDIEYINKKIYYLQNFSTTKPEYKFYDGNELTYLITASRSIVVKDYKDRIVRNKFIKNKWFGTNKILAGTSGEFIFYVNENGNLANNIILNIGKNKYIVDSDCKVLSNVILFDSDFYEKENKKSDINPYVKIFGNYNVRRDLIKQYLGYSVNEYGEIVMEDSDIEIPYMTYKKKDSTDKDEYLCVNIKNGEYNSDIVKYIIDSKNVANQDLEYEYKEIDEGIIKKVHNKKEVGKRIEYINDSDIDDQISHRKSLEEKSIVATTSNLYNELDETVKFGKYYIYDKTGKELDPISWDIVKKENGKALLIATKDIDCLVGEEYSTNDLEKTYSAESQKKIYEWLNNEFYNFAFTDDEKDHIVEYGNDKYKVFSYNESEIFYLQFLPKELRANELNSFVYPILKNYEDILKSYRVYGVNDDVTRYLENKRIKFYEEGNKLNIYNIRPVIWVKYNDDGE